jgi:type II secretion system protein N
MAMILRRAVVYPLYFVICTLVFAYCTFPYDRVRDRIEEELERSIPGADVEIAWLSPSWFTGVELGGVRLTLPPEAPDERPTAFSLTEVSVRLGLFDSLSGTTSISYFAELGGGGTIEGVYEQREDALRVQARLDGVALGRIGPMRRVLQLPVSGTLRGEIDVTLAVDVVQTQGTAALEIADLAIGDGHARLQLPGTRTGVTVERLEAGNLQVRMQIERGVGRLQQLAATSDDIEIRGAGTVRLLSPIRMSSLDVLLRIDVKQPYRERNDRTRAIFAMLDMSPDVRAYRAPDGAFQLRLSGSLGGGRGLRAEPAGTAAIPN